MNEYWIVRTATVNYAFQSLSLAQTWAAQNAPSGGWAISRLTVSEEVWSLHGVSGGQAAPSATLTVASWAAGTDVLPIPLMAPVQGTSS